MLVSVVIPAYNSEKYIDKAINSVLNQTYQDFEIIIIDDGSVDNTRQIIENTNDSRIKYIYQENSGPAAARNNGIKNASGEYIAFLDSDDVWLPEKLEKQIKILKKESDICLVFTAFVMQDEGKEKKEIYRFKTYKNEKLVKNLLLNPMATVPYPSTVMIKKSYLDMVGYFDTELYTSEDWDLWMRLATKANFYYIDEVLVNRFRPKTSITSSLDLSKVEECYLKVVNNFFDQNAAYSKLKLQGFSYVYFNLALAYFYRNLPCPPFKKVLDFIFKSIKDNPAYLFEYLISYRKFKFLARISVEFFRRTSN